MKLKHPHLLGKWFGARGNKQHYYVSTTYVRLHRDLLKLSKGGK